MKVSNIKKNKQDGRCCEMQLGAYGHSLVNLCVCRRVGWAGSELGAGAGGVVDKSESPSLLAVFCVGEETL